jgi:hypothetical protein
MSFQDDLETHLQAVCDRDIDTLEASLSKDSSITLILPNGALRETKEDFIEFHESWFEDQDWSITHEIVSTKESTSSAHAIVQSMFKDKDEDGKDYEVNMLISFMFVREDGLWKMGHCQNTVVK